MNTSTPSSPTVARRSFSRSADACGCGLYLIENANGSIVRAAATRPYQYYSTVSGGVRGLPRCSEKSFPGAEIAVATCVACGTTWTPARGVIIAAATAAMKEARAKKFYAAHEWRSTTPVAPVAAVAAVERYSCSACGERVDGPLAVHDCPLAAAGIAALDAALDAALGAAMRAAGWALVDGRPVPPAATSVAINRAAFALESVAHLQGREADFLPLAEALRAIAPASGVLTDLDVENL